MPMKAVRDGVVTGTPASLVMALMIGAGVPLEVATPLSILVAMVASTLYRYVRHRCPWLLAVDAPTQG